MQPRALFPPTTIALGSQTRVTKGSRPAPGPPLPRPGTGGVGGGGGTGERERGDTYAQ